MSEWTKRTHEHPVWSEMQQLGPAIDKAQTMEGINTDATDALERLRLVLTYAGRRLGSADPSLIVPGPLNTIADALREMRTRTELFAGDKNLDHLREANVQADNVLAHVATIVSLVSPEETAGLVATANNARALLERTIDETKRMGENAKTGADSAITQLNALKESIQTEQQRIAQALTDFQQKFTEGQEKRNAEYSEALRQAQQNLAQITTDQQGQFSTAQDTRSREYQTDQASRQAKFGELVSSYTEKLTQQNADFTKQREELIRGFQGQLNELNTQYSEKADGIVKTIEEHQTHVEKLVGVIGNLGVTSGYLTTANHARKTLWFWQAVTVVAMCSLVGFAYKTLGLLEDGNGSFHWGMFAGRVFLLVSLGLLAAYTANQADKAFEVEKRNRKLALELEAMGPYLAPLPQEEQDKFRLQVGDRSFGQEDSTTKGNGRSPATLIDLASSKEVRQFLELLLSLKK